MAICLTNYKIVVTFANKTQKVIDVQSVQQLKLPKDAVLTLVEVATAKPPAKLVTKRLPGQLVFEIEGEGVIAQIQDSETSPAAVSLDTSFSPATQQEVTGQTSSNSEICPPTAVSASSKPMAADSLGNLGAVTAWAFGGAAALLSSKPEPKPATVVARVVAGPVLPGNDLEATIYKADGVSVLGTGKIGADGSVTVSVGNYTGVVVVKVQNNGGPTDPDNIPDYMDEATAERKDLGSAVLYSAGVLVQEGAVLVLNVNILTSLAHHIAKQKSQPGAPLDASTVENSNKAIANAFDLNDLTGAAVQTTIDQNGANSANAANLYGKILASLSGADAINGGDTQQTFLKLTNSINFDGSKATLQADALDLLIEGAKTADPTNAIELVKKLSNATTLSSPSVTIAAVSVNNEINASETQGSEISGTCAAGSSVTIAVGGNVRTATVTGTTWSYTLSAADFEAMGQGAETLLVTATRNGQSASVSRGIFIDTVAPSAPSVNALLSNDTSPVITGNSPLLTAEERLTVTVNGATFNVRPGNTGAWSLDLGTATPTTGSLGALANGQTYTVTATVRDAAGNTSPTSTNTLTIDTTAPTLTMNAVSGGFINNAEAQSALILTGTSNAEDGQIVSFTLGNKTYTATVNAGAWSASVPSADLQALPQGDLTLTPQIADAAGNLTQLNPAASVIVDTLAPAQPSVAANMLDGSDSGTSETDNNTRNTRPELQVGTLPSNASSVEMLVNGQRVPATYNSQTGVLQPTSALPDGVHAISYRYVDAAGNLSPASASLSMTIDATAPINVAITGATSGGITGMYEAGTTLSLTIAGQAVQPIILDPTNGTWRYDPTPGLAALRSMAGTQQVVLTATDTAGNTASANRTVSADNFNGPYIKEFIPADSGVIANAANDTATLNLVFSKEVVKVSGDIRLFEVGNPTAVATISVTSNSVVIQGGNDVYITLPRLTIGSQYYVTLAAGTFVDLAGEAYVGLLATGTDGWDFTAVAASISPNFVAADDLINIAENGAVVLISGKVVGSQAILNDIVAGNLTITVNVPTGQPPLPAITPVYDPATGEFSFSVPANAWREGTYGYTVALAGGSGTAANVTANYAFNDLRVDLTAPTMVASVQGAQDNVGTIAGEIWAASNTATSDDTSPVISGTLSALLTGDARVVVYRRDVTDSNNPGSLSKITGSEGLTPTGLGWSVTDAGLQDGRRYDYVAYVEDAAGNRSQANPVKTILIDTTTPVVQVTTLALSDDSGSSGSDRITNVASQTVTGTLSGPLATGETLHSSLDGGQTWVDISSFLVAGTTLSWSGVTLPQGQGQMLFRVKDAAGNQGPTSTLGFTLDQTPPAAPTSAPDLLAADDSGSNSDNITNNTQPSLVVGALPQGMAGAQLLVNGELVEAVYDAAHGSLSPVQALGDGENSLSLRWVDTAGNLGAAGPAVTVQIDTIAPSLRMINIAISADSGSSNSDFVTRTAAQTITGQLNSALASGDKVFGSFNGGSSWTDITSLINAGGQLTWAGMTLPAGNSSLQFKVEDVAGNVSAISRQDYSMDQTAPGILVPNIVISADTGVSASDFITKEATQTVTGRLMVGNQPQALQSGDRLWASSNGGANWQDITTNVSGDAFTWANVSLTNGASSLQFKVIDAAGNEGGVSRQNYTLDTLAPAAPQTQNSAPFDLLTPDQDTGIANTDDITQVTRPAFMVQNKPVDAVGAELLINGRLIDATFSAQDNTLTPNAPLVDGVYQVSYRYLDAAGNISAAGSATQVTIDTRAPANASLATFTPTSIGGTYEPGSTLSLKINGVDIAANRIVLNAANSTWSLVPNTTELTTAGTGLQNKATSTFDLTATDAAGNVTVASETVSKDVFNAPYVKEFIPADGGILANDTTGQATLNLVFSKEVRAGTGKIKLFNVSGNVLVAEMDVTSKDVSIQNGADVYVALPSLTTGVRYYVTLDAGTFVDSANQGYAGKGETGTAGWDFVGAVASIAPDFVAQDDIINFAESAAEVRITGKVVSSAAVLEDIVLANLSVSVSAPQVIAALQSYNNQTGEFVFAVPASVWANGNYGYTVSLAGNAGDANGVTTSYNFANLAVDLVAPTGIAASIDGITDNVGQIQGNLYPTSSGTGLTDDNTPTLSGSLTRVLAQDERIAIDRTDGQSNTVTITGKAGLIVDGTSWTVNDGTLADGQYTYGVYVEDAAGNRTASSPSRLVNVDTQAPTLSLTAFALSQDTGSNTTDRITKEANQTISGTLSQPLGSGVKLLASMDGGITYIDVTGFVTNTTLNWTQAALTPGAGAIQLVVRDSAGNQSSATQFAFHLDQQAPTSRGGGSASIDENVSVGTVVYRSNFTDNHSSTLSYAISGADAGFFNIDSVSGAVTLKISPDFEVKSRYNFAVSAVDVAGNNGTQVVQLSINDLLDAPPSPIVNVAATGNLVASNTQQIRAARALGDINGDGFDDIAFSSVTGTYAIREQQYVLYGSGDLANVVTASQLLQGRSLMMQQTTQESYLNLAAVSSAGDFNNDGKTDVLAGFNPSANRQRSEINIYLNNKSGINSVTNIEVKGGVDVYDQYRAQWRSYNDSLGYYNAMQAAGDINGDGIDDIIIGAFGADLWGEYQGQTYAIFGKNTPIDVVLTLGNLTNGGFKFWGANNVSLIRNSGTSALHMMFNLGADVAGVGDFNGDGRADFLVRDASPNTYNYGLPSAWLVFGKADGAAVSTSAFTNKGILLNNLGLWPGETGTLSYAGDFNGDGRPDLIIGDQTTALGTAYIVFGGYSAASLNLDSLVQGSEGLTIHGISATEKLNSTVSYAGDINADGLSDVILSSMAADGGNGRTYVVYGRAGATPISLSDINNGVGGFAITTSTGKNLGSALSNAGDVNGDGLEDLMLSQQTVNGTTITGPQGLLILTNAAVSGSKVSQMGTAQADTLSDNAVSQSLIGGLGDDLMLATAASVLYGGAGNDTFVIGNLMANALKSSYGSGGNADRLARIDGGSGLDTIRLADGVDLDLTQVANQSSSLLQGGSRIDDVEIIDLGVQGANTLKLTLADVIDMSSANVFEATGRKQLLVKGATGDTLDFADGAGTSGWTQAADVTIDTVVYSAWNHNTAFASVYVQSGIFVV